MDQMTRIVPMLLLLAYVIKIGSSSQIDLSQALVAIGLIALYGLNELNLNKKEKKILSEEIASAKNELSNRIKDLEDKYEEVKDIKSHITAIKATSQLQGQKNPLTDNKNYRF
jgi:predicted nuclease with TOPRIM domain